MGGRLEYAVRLLPQVLACSLTNEGDIVVLADPSADTRILQTTVERVARGAGAAGSIRVMGPADPVALAATRSMSPLVSTATIATVAAIGVGTLIGGLAVADQHPAPQRPLVVTSSTAPSGSLETVRGLLVRPAPGTVPQPAPAPEAIPRPASQPAPVPSGHLPIEAPDLARAAALAFFQIGPRRESRSKHETGDGGTRAFAARGRSRDREAAAPHSRSNGSNGHRTGRRLPTWSEAYLPPHPGEEKGPAIKG